jgi:short-chain fatty acids transporter
MDVRGELAGSWFSRAGLRLSDWFERWFPDAFALALVAVLIVFSATLLVGSTPMQAATWFGAGFWDLVVFTMQMTLIILTGYSVATAPLVYRLVCRLAEIPKTGRGAVAFVALFSMLSSLISWSFSLIISGLLAREVTHRVKGADYRAVGAAHLGIGSVWALGLSSSAALIMAAGGSLLPSIMNISGVIPLSQTLLLWQSMLTAAVIVVMSIAIAYYSAPAASHARSMADMGVTYAVVAVPKESPERPGEWLEYSPLLSLVVGLFGVAYLVSEVASKGASVILELNHYVFLFLIAGILLHWRPRSFVRSIAAAVPSVAGVLVQYPMYAGMVKMMTESGLARQMAHFFVDVSTKHSYPLLIGVYSAFLGLFVPSAGGKWLIEAPYMLQGGLREPSQSACRCAIGRSNPRPFGCCSSSISASEVCDIACILPGAVHVPFFI